MSTINKRYKRDIKKNLMYYISATILTALSIAMFVTCVSGGQDILKYVHQFYDDNNLESAQIVLKNNITDKQLDDLEKEYDVTLETQRYVNFEEDGYTLRAFAGEEKINTYEVIGGKDISASSQALLSKGFADAKGIEIGDSITLGDNKYEVAGFALRPDYLMMLENPSDIYHNNDKFGLVFITQSELQRQSRINEYISVKYNDDNSEDFRKALNDRYGIASYLPYKINHRCKNIMTEPVSYVVMGYFMLVCTLLLTVALICIVLGRRIKKEQKQIGTLYALGYRKKEMKKHYIIYAVIPGIAGTILGIILSEIIVPILGKLFLADYEPLPVKFTLPALCIVIAILLPTLMYVTISNITIRRLLAKNPVLLLNNNADSGKSKEGIKLKRSMSFIRKYRLRVITNNKGRTLAIVLGIALGTFVLSFGMISLDSCEKFIDTGTDGMGDYNYAYYLNSFKYDEAPKDAKGTILAANYQLKGKDTQITLMGCDDNMKLGLKSTSGEEIKPADGVYLTSTVAGAYGFEKGDKITLCDFATLDEYTFEIDDIVDDAAQRAIYLSRKEAAATIGVPENFYSVIISDKKLNLDENEISTTVTKESLREQISDVIDGTKSMIYMLIALGAVLCVMAVCIMVNMHIEENKVSISMLKVLGYRKKELKKMILNVNDGLVPVAIVLGILVALTMSKVYFIIMIDAFGCFLPVAMDYESIILCVAVIAASYLITLTALKKKIMKVNMVESMKDNRN